LVEPKVFNKFMTSFYDEKTLGLFSLRVFKATIAHPFYTVFTKLTRLSGRVFVLNPLLRAALFLMLFLLAPCHVFGWEMRGGLSLMEEGDDRLRGGVVLESGARTYEAKLFYFYRAFGPVEQNTLELAFDKTFPVPFLSNLYGAVGLALLRERSFIDYQNPTLTNKEDVFYNVGLHTGVFWKFKSNGPLNFFITWQSSIFPAGVGGIFLATGRKQFITFESGVDL
jgi:hypothetical protein